MPRSMTTLNRDLVLPAAGRRVGAGGLRPVLRRTVPGVLPRETGTTLAGSGYLFPADDDVTVSRTRRLISAAAHQQVFGWVLKRLARGGLMKGKTIGIDSTTLEANAAMKSIVRRDTQESYTD